jgi:hypothetical protein
MSQLDSPESKGGICERISCFKMTTTIWFRENGTRYFAKLACQNGRVKVLEAKTEEGEQVDPEFICKPATKAYKRINSYGDLPNEEPIEEEN